MITIGAAAGLAPVVKAAAYTASSGEMVLGDASSAAFSVTLPASPVDGATVLVKKIDSTTSAVTVLPNSGQTINGSMSLVLSTQESAVRLVYYATTTRWMVVDTAAATVASNVITVGASAGGGSSSGGGGMFFPWTGSGRIFTSPTPGYYYQTTLTYVNNYTLFYPVMVPNACSIASVSVGTGGGATTYLSLWSDASSATSGGPATRLTYGSSAQAMATASMPYTFSGPTPIWVGIGASASITFQCCASTADAKNGLQNLVIGTLAQALLSSVGAAAATSKYVSTIPYNGASTVSNASTYSMSINNAGIPIFFFTLA